jgi:carboxylesterase type B
MADVLVGGEKSRAIAEVVHRAWVDFARTGNPDPSGDLGWTAADAAGTPSLLLSDRTRLDSDRDESLLQRWGLDG